MVNEPWPAVMLLRLVAYEEHLGQRNDRLDNLKAAGNGVHAGNMAAASGHIRRDVAEVRGGNSHIDRDDRLEQHGPGLLESLSERGGRGGLERLLRTVDRVILAEIDFDLEVDDLVARDDSLFHLLAYALFDGGDVLAGNGAALDGVHEAESLAPVERPHPQVDLAELAAAAGLLLVSVVGLGIACDRLKVGHVRECAWSSRAYSGS